MGKFKTFCGKEFEQENDGKFSRVLIQRIYPGKEHEDIKIASKCWICPARKVNNVAEFFNLETRKTFIANDIYCLAENVDFKERKLVDCYCGACSNTSIAQTIEVVLQSDEFRAIILRQSKGNCTGFNLMEDIPREIWEEMQEKAEEYDEPHPIIRMTSDDGECVNVDIESEYDLEGMIVSMRVVEFEEIFREDKDAEIHNVTDAPQGTI